MAKPKWATPIRQAHLLRLWSEYGNRCLLGHRACPDPSHYVHLEAKRSIVPIAKPFRCQDSHGSPILDSEGKQAYGTAYAFLTDTVYEPVIIRLYDLKSEQIIEVWKAEDRAERKALAKAERKALHSLGERRYPLRGQFSAIGKDIFYPSQPSHYVEGLGISGLTFEPFAKVRIASSYMRLFVELGDTLKGVSKSKRRKAIRYGKALPVPIQKRIELLCSLAVRHYLSK